MPDVLDTRLASVSPVVDTDRALTFFRGRRRQAARRRQLARVAIPVVLALLVGGAAVAVARHGDDPQSVVAVDDPLGPARIGQRRPQAGTAKSSGKVSFPLESLELRDTIMTDQGIEVTITAPVQAVAGTRIPVDVHIRNVGDREVFWEAGGCAIPRPSPSNPARSTISWLGPVTGNQSRDGGAIRPT